MPPSCRHYLPPAFPSWRGTSPRPWVINSSDVLSAECWVLLLLAVWLFSLHSLGLEWFPTRSCLQPCRQHLNLFVLRRMFCLWWSPLADVFPCSFTYTQSLTKFYRNLSVAFRGWWNLKTKKKVLGTVDRVTYLGNDFYFKQRKAIGVMCYSSCSTKYKGPIFLLMDYVWTTSNRLRCSLTSVLLYFHNTYCRFAILYFCLSEDEESVQICSGSQTNIQRWPLETWSLSHLFILKESFSIDQHRFLSFLGSCVNQGHPLAGNRGESKEVLGFHGDPVYYTFGDLLLLRRDSEELGMVDSTVGVFDYHGRNWWVSSFWVPLLRRLSIVCSA